LSSFVLATGACVPERALTNEDLEKLVDTNDEWIRTRTGIASRAMVAPGEATSDLATRAAQKALARAKLRAEDLDLIMVATCTPDLPLPSTANLVHRNLRPEATIPSFDLNAACSGFIYGLEVADKLLGSGAYQRVLLVGAEALTRFTDYTDRDTCVLFGDGAGAVILEACDGERGIVATTLGSDGEFWELIHVPGTGSLRPASPYLLAQHEQFIRMNGSQTFRMAVPALEQVARTTLDKAGWKVADVDHVIVHQANQRIIDAVAERLEIPPEKLPCNIERTGNTSAASIPVLLDECERAGRLKPGQRVLCAAFGAGLTWGAAALIW
jgi:3-oxoacyl-[acyl-carrier-protein] synthase-3